VVAGGVGQSAALVPSAGAPGRETSTVTFQVQVNTNYGEEVWVCGSDAALGEWIPTKGVMLKTTKDSYPLWVARVQVTCSLACTCHATGM